MTPTVHKDKEVILIFLVGGQTDGRMTPKVLKYSKRSQKDPKENGLVRGNDNALQCREGTEKDWRRVKEVKVVAAACTAPLRAIPACSRGPWVKETPSSSPEILRIAFTKGPQFSTNQSQPFSDHFCKRIQLV